MPTAGAPMGGTELLLSCLTGALPALTAQVQIICSRPELVALDPDRPRLLWLHDLPHDPASACLKDRAYRAQFNALVFVSHWQQAQYHQVLGIPYSEGLVIRNGVPRLAPALPKPDVDGRLHFIYTSTPHRGLALLATAADALAHVRQDWRLHVYSSFGLYGWHDADARYEPLYDALRANPCVRYYGARPNDEVRDAVLQAHVWVYPSVYAETSCLAAQEALMAGCLGITSSLGALPETCGAWPWMFAFDESPEVMCVQTLQHMQRALAEYWRPETQDRLVAQRGYFQRFWSFESRVVEWEGLLTRLASERPGTRLTRAKDGAEERI